MDHGLDIERRVHDDLLRLGRRPATAAGGHQRPALHPPGDAGSHAALLCVQSGSTLADPDRFKFDADEFYLKTPQEMRHLWRELPEACDNTLLIAERCEVSFTEGANLMPRFPVPAGESEESWFIKEVDRVWPAATRRVSRPMSGRAPTSSPASFWTWGFRATSWWSPT